MSNWLVSISFEEIEMIRCVSRPLSNTEPDLLIGNEYAPLTVKNSFTRKQIKVIAPPALGWTHDKLETTCASLRLNADEAYDVYLSKQWIGSSEI